MGEAAALLSALMWAGSSTLMGWGTGRLPSAVVSALRLVGATVLLWVVAAVLVAGGRLDGVSALHALSLAASGILGPAVGDTIYIRSMRAIGVARAFPISMAAFPLMTVLLAAPFAGEPITAGMLVGGALVIVGAYLVAVRPTPEPLPVFEPEVEPESSPRPSLPAEMSQGSERFGVVLVLVAAAIWAVASVWTVNAARDLSPVTVAAIRMPAAALFTIVLARASWGALRGATFDRRTLAMVLGAGMVGTGLGSLVWVFAVQHAGAARTAILSSMAPIFALPLAALWLKERVTGRVVIGTLISIAGVWLVVT
jgi:drug/metabolite transporter, DME family